VSGCEGAKGLDLLAVVLYRKDDKHEPIKKRVGKLYSRTVWHLVAYCKGRTAESTAGAPQEVSDWRLEW
jgi:hypothetical protein